jgi:GNAT superfamily N-acetyltransferase
MPSEDVFIAHELLCQSAQLRPVPHSEGRRFSRWDLASFAEGALGEVVEPEGLTPSGETRLRERLGEAGRVYEHDDRWSRRYWLVGAAGVVGTIAVGMWPRGWGCLGVSSLYVHPSARRRGVAGRALETVYEATLAAGLNGIRLDTHWTWQDAVRYYLGRGMWVANWQHCLSLEKVVDRPAYEVRDSGDELGFWIEEDRQRAALLLAERDGEWLRLRETDLHRRIEEEQELHSGMLFHAQATFALHLAVRGWPLVRRVGCDIGGPEGLARKLRIFEKTAREDGWRVEMPTLPVPTPVPVPVPVPYSVPAVRG